MGDARAERMIFEVAKLDVARRRLELERVEGLLAIMLEEAIDARARLLVAVEVAELAARNLGAAAGGDLEEARGAERTSYWG